MTHDELLAKINYDIEGNPYDEYMSALRAVVELTARLKDTESWQDDVDYKNGYNNAMNDIRLTIEKELQ